MAPFASPLVPPATQTSDEDLVERLGQPGGDPAAFQELLDRRLEWLLPWLRQQAPAAGWRPEDVDDAAQEARLSLWEAACAYRQLPEANRCGFRTFFNRVLHRRLGKFCGRHWRYESGLDRTLAAAQALVAAPAAGSPDHHLEGWPKAPAGDPLRILLLAELTALVEQALAGLDGRLRRVGELVLARVPVRGIALALGADRRQAKYLRAWVRTYLQAQLGPWWW
jgi:DNA-directed RNA polymerase specialized sigma24 family protein